MPLTIETSRQQVREAASAWTPVSDTNLRERQRAVRVFNLYRHLKVPVLLVVLILLGICSAYLFPRQPGDRFNGVIFVVGAIMAIGAYFILTRGLLRRWLSTYLARREVWLASAPILESDDGLEIEREPDPLRFKGKSNPWAEQARKNAIPVTPYEPLKKS